MQINFTDDEVFPILKRMRGSSDGEKFIEWLKYLLVKYEKLLPYVIEEIELRWLQGECRALTNILNMIETADQKIDTATYIKNKKTMHHPSHW